MEAWSLQPACSYCQWSFVSRRKDSDSLRRAASRFLYCSTMKSQGRFCILCHFYCLCTLRLLVLFPQLELVLPSSSTLALPVSLNRSTPSFTRLHCSFLLKFSGIRDHGHTSWDSSHILPVWSDWYLKQEGFPGIPKYCTVSKGGLLHHIALISLQDSVLHCLLSADVWG